MQPINESHLEPCTTALHEFDQCLDNTFEYVRAPDSPPDSPGLQENIERLNANIYSLARMLTTVIGEYHDRRVTPHQYDRVRERLKLLNDRYSGKHPSIKTIHDAAEKALHTRSPSPVQILSQVASWAAGCLPLTVQNQFYDYNQPWKQMKYELSLKLLADAYRINRRDLLSIYTDMEDVSEFEQPLVLHTREVIHLLLDLVMVKPDGYRERFHNFLEKLRYVISCPTFQYELCRYNRKINPPPATDSKSDLHPEDNLSLDFVTSSCEYDPCVEELLHLCWFMYTEVHLFPFCKNVVDSLLNDSQAAAAPVQPQGRPLSLSTMLEQDFAKIKSAPLQAPLMATNSQKLRGTLNLGFDPHGTQNRPFVLYDFQYVLGANSVKNVRVLRIGTPTRQRYDSRTMTYQGEAEIVPEFDKFIYMLTKVKKKKILDISLQEDVERLMCSESERSTAVRQLHEKDPDNFLMAILSKDSDFYYQRGEFAELNNSRDFKIAFLCEMLTPLKNGYFFPRKWKEDQVFTDELKRLLEVVHRDVFDGADLLSVAQRQDFIEIYYARLVLFLIKYSGADYFFPCCKDSADRAMMVNALIFVMMMLMLEKETDPSYVETFRVYVHAAAMLVKKQAMDHGRRTRLLAALRRLEREEVIGRIRAWKSEFPIVGEIRVQKPAGQDIPKLL